MDARYDEEGNVILTAMYQADLRGSLPEWIKRMVAINSISWLGQAKTLYDKTWGKGKWAKA